MLGGGKRFIIGKQAPLSVADQNRIDAFESELRLLVPESRPAVTEVVNIAFGALGAVRWPKVCANVFSA